MWNVADRLLMVTCWYAFIFSTSLCALKSNGLRSICLQCNRMAATGSQNVRAKCYSHHKPFGGSINITTQLDIGLRLIHYITTKDAGKHERGTWSQVKIVAYCMIKKRQFSQVNKRTVQIQRACDLWSN